MGTAVQSHLRGAFHGHDGPRVQVTVDQSLLRAAPPENQPTGQKTHHAVHGETEIMMGVAGQPIDKRWRADMRHIG